MSAASGNRLREGEVVSGILELDPRSDESARSEGDTLDDDDPDGESNDKSHADRDRPRSGLRATLGELVGAGKQGGRHAR